MPVETRYAQLEDAAALARLLLQLGYDGDSERVRRRLHRVLGRPDNVAFVGIERPHGIVGLIHAAVQVTLIERAYAEIGALVVASESRSAGVGRTLLDKVHAWATERGLEDVVVRSQAHRTSAHEFFMKLGYAKIKNQLVFRRGVSHPARTGDNTVMD